MSLLSIVDLSTLITKDTLVPTRRAEVLAYLCHPFTVKDGSFSSFSSITNAEYNSALYGTKLTSSYPLTASIQREFIAAASLPTTELSSTDDFFSARKRMIALGNTLNRNKLLSPSFEYSSSNPVRALRRGRWNLIFIIPVP